MFHHLLMIFLMMLSSGFFYTISTSEIRSWIVMAKISFTRKRSLMTGSLSLNLCKKLIKCYMWSIALYGLETYRGKYRRNIWRALNCGVGRFGKLKWADMVTNENVLKNNGWEEVNCEHCSLEESKLDWIAWDEIAY